jgi:Spy/CpxP family protein refolding chaperone
MNKKTYFFSALLLAAGLAVPAQEARRSWSAAFDNLRFGLHMAENNLFEARFILRLKGELGLTPAQEQRIGDLMLAHEEAAIRRSSDIKVLELKFASLLKGNRIDRREMEKMARDIGARKTDLQVDHLNYLLDLRDTLTAEQLQKIEKLKKEIAERVRSKMRERRGEAAPRPAPRAENAEAAESDAL